MRTVTAKEPCAAIPLSAYSAAELLSKATDEKAVSWEIKDPKLAVTLSKSLSCANGSQNAVFSDARLKRRLGQFVTGDDDVRIAAVALSVLVAHGSFTPARTDSLTKAGDEALQRLCDVLLQECERRSGTWPHEMLVKRGEAASPRALPQQPARVIEERST